MKRFIFLFALSPLFACATQDDTRSGTSDLDVAFACRTTADCPTPTVCGPDAECHLPTTVPPILKCTTDATCPPHERCNPICSTIGVVGHVCQPEGVPTQECPVIDPPPPSTGPSTVPHH